MVAPRSINERGRKMIGPISVTARASLGFVGAVALLTGSSAWAQAPAAEADKQPTTVAQAEAAPPPPTPPPPAPTPAAPPVAAVPAAPPPADSTAATVTTTPATPGPDFKKINVGVAM